MHRSAVMSIKLIKYLLLNVCLLLSLSAIASPQDSLQLSVQISMEKVAFSGVCLIIADSSEVYKGAIVNEFGIKAFTFIYNERKSKIHLFEIMPLLNRWYIRRILRRDLQQIIPQIIIHGKCKYTNPKYRINYSFQPLEQEHDAISE